MPTKTRLSSKVTKTTKSNSGNKKQNTTKSALNMKIPMRPDRDRGMS